MEIVPYKHKSLCWTGSMQLIYMGPSTKVDEQGGDPVQLVGHVCAGGLGKQASVSFQWWFVSASLHAPHLPKLCGEPYSDSEGWLC